MDEWSFVHYDMFEKWIWNFQGAPQIYESEKDLYF